MGFTLLVVEDVVAPVVRERRVFTSTVVALELRVDEELHGERVEVELVADPVPHVKREDFRYSF